MYTACHVVVAYMYRHRIILNIVGTHRESFMCGIVQAIFNVMVVFFFLLQVFGTGEVFNNRSRHTEAIVSFLGYK